MSTLFDFRKAKDEFFKFDPQSPLDHDQMKSFSGLNYYLENPDLRYTLPLEKVQKTEPITLATSTGDEQDYLHIGQIRFAVKGKEAILQVYVSSDGGDYSITFVDATAPVETYGAGRYLEPEDLGGGQLLV